MADLSVLKLPNNATYNIKDASAVSSVTENNKTVTVVKRDGTSTTFSVAYAEASSSAAGLMSATDKARFDFMYEAFMNLYNYGTLPLLDTNSDTVMDTNGNDVTMTVF